MRSSATAGGSPLQRQRVHRLSSKPAAVSVASLRPAGGEPAVDHRLANAFALTAGLLCALAVGFVARRAPPGETVSRGLFELVVVGVPVATGLYALRSPRDARFGAMLLGAGLAWTLTALGESQDSLAYSVGRVAAWLVFPWLIYLLLAFPQGRIGAGLDRALFRALNLVLAVLFVGSALFVAAYPGLTPWASCRAHCPANAFMLVSREPAAMSDVVQPVREALAVLLFAGVTVAMARRWRASSRLRRGTIAPVMVASGVSVVLLAVFFQQRRYGSDPDATETLGRLWGLSVPAIAAAFLAGLMRRRLRVGQVLATLGGRLNDEPGTPALRAALAAALGDPTLELLVPDGPARWRDSRGAPAEALPAAAAGREVTVLRDGRGAGVALVHDAELRSDDELVSAVGSLVIASLRQERLKARLAVSLDQLAHSRQRIARAADLERARIERDLHDGAQQRLIGLRMRLSLAEELLRTDPAAGAAAVMGLGGEVERTLEELRSLAHGVYPSMLRDRGLPDALAGITSQAPLPVHLHTVAVTRQSMEIESAVYFTCAEAVQNAVKHARSASSVWIILRQAGSTLTAEVRDDGPGFVPPSPDDGTPPGGGLRNMRDRIEAVGGRLTIDSSPGRGTRILAVVPLG